MTSRGLPKTSGLAKAVGIRDKSVLKILDKFDVAGQIPHRLTAPEKIKIPPVPAPAPTPTSLDEEALQKDRARRRQRINASGRGGTILTGGSTLGTPRTTSSSNLGG